MSEAQQLLADLITLVERFEANDTGIIYAEEPHGNLDAAMVEEKAQDILRLAMQLILSVVPTRIFQVAYLDTDYDSKTLPDIEECRRDALISLLNKLVLFKPLLYASGGKPTLSPVIDGLIEVAKGGESEFVGKSAFKGPGNRSPSKVSALRATAIIFYRAGRKHGVSAADLQEKLLSSYGASYDTIRRWEAYCRNVYTDAYFEIFVANGLDLWCQRFASGTAFDAIAEMGQTYKEVWKDARN